MFEARQGKEVVVRVKNDIGLLFKLSKRLSEKGLSILAVSGAATGQDCLIRLVTDDNLRAKDALADSGYGHEEQDVILMELAHKPGILKHVTEALAEENIDVRHVYATMLEQHKKCLLVLHTSDDERALPKLNKLNELYSTLRTL